MDSARADVARGLTDAEVASRVATGQVNIVPDPPDRSLGQIVAANTFTVVNAIILTLFVLVLISGNPQDGLFVGVVVSNMVIGVVQEVRARAELRRLTVVTEPSRSSYDTGHRWRSRPMASWSTTSSNFDSVVRWPSTVRRWPRPA